MSASFACPSCGAPVVFKSNANVFMVCAHCTSMLVRHDVNLEDLGKMAELQGDLSPLMVGTRGQIGSQAFELIGRLKVVWSDGAWNEWYVRFDDGREGWLAEAQGTYAMSFPVADAKLPERSQIRLGLELDLKLKKGLRVSDIKTATCVGSEGELPFAAPKGREILSVDLIGLRHRFASLEYAVGAEPQAFVGDYYEFDELRLTGVRKFDGW